MRKFLNEVLSDCHSVPSGVAMDKGNVVIVKQNASSRLTALETKSPKA